MLFRTKLRWILSSVSHHHLILRLTLVLVALYGTTAVVLLAPIRAIATIMLVVPVLLREAVLWWALFGLTAVGCVIRWHVADNHKYLISYWVFACALALSGSERMQQLRTSARLLTAATFSCAVVWKGIAADYLDGSFFYYTFLTDGRLQPFAATVVGESVGTLVELGRTLQALGDTGDVSSAVAIPRYTSLYRMAFAISWVGVLLEATVAATHWTSSQWAYQARHYSLMCFIATVYFLLPVFPFAFVLAVLGLAQCQDNLMRVRYFVLIVFIHLTLIPWRSMLS